MKQPERLETVLYDPNGQNPYGTELALVLQALGRTVDHWVPPIRSYVGSPGVRVRPDLGGPLNTARDRATALRRRLIAPVRAVFLARHNVPVIAAWTADPWDAIVLGARSLVSDKVFVILHNPRQVAGRAGRWAALERILLRRCTICLHSERLAALAAEDFPRRAVTPHPPYSRAVGAAPPWNPADVAERAGLPRISFIGDPRPDKGVEDLVTVAEAIDDPFELCILGSKRLPADVTERILQSGHTVQQSAGEQRLTDEDLVAGLLESRLVIAPYRAVTDSGSVRLATAVGVPVVAYDTEGLRELLPATQLAADVQALAQLVQEELTSPQLPVGQLSLDEQHDRALAAWKELLDER